MLQTKEEIIKWLDKYEIKNYTINNDLSVDVDDDWTTIAVSLDKKCLLSIDVQFNIANGHFSCSNNKLTSLKGCPRIVKGNFSCKNNKLKSLDYLPDVIYGKIYCDKHLYNTKEYKIYQLMKALKK